MSFLLGLLLAGVSPMVAGAQETVVTPAASPAAPAVNWLEPLTSRQHVQVNENGELTGDLSYFANNGQRRALPNMAVSIVSGGQVVGRVRTTAEGVWGFPSIRPGIYTIVASNPDQLLVLPVMVSGVAADPQPLSLIAASPITPGRRQAMLAALHAPMAVPPSAPVPMENWPEPRGVFQAGTVSLDANGDLVGQISVMGYPIGGVDLTGMVIRLTRDNQPIGEALVNPDGSFVVTGVTPGPAAVFAFGPQGFAAMGIEIIGGARVSQVADEQAETFVNMLQGASDQLQFEIAPTPDVLAAAQQIPGDSFTDPLAGAVPPGGVPGGAPFGGGGGGFGGGGAGGGGGGLGGIGALGALGAAAAIAATNDDNNFVPPPTSPAF